jgi:hypothetical protein
MKGKFISLLVISLIAYVRNSLDINTISPTAIVVPYTNVMTYGMGSSGSIQNGVSTNSNVAQISAIKSKLSDLDFRNNFLNGGLNSNIKSFP